MYVSVYVSVYVSGVVLVLILGCFCGDRDAIPLVNNSGLVSSSCFVWWLCIWLDHI